jgi:hypothetical protein
VKTLSRKQNHNINDHWKIRQWVAKPIYIRILDYILRDNVYMGDMKRNINHSYFIL